MEGLRLIWGFASVELFGWTDPGTEITVNGQKLPVSEEGIFTESVALSPTRDTIIITAKNEEGEKIVVRRFKVN